MNKQILWTTAALLTTTLAIPMASLAEIGKVVKSSDSQIRSSANTNAKESLQVVVKVGEYQSPVKKQTDGGDGAVIARIQSHQDIGSNRQAATIYIHNLPILTFLSAKPQVTSSTKSIHSSQEVKVATTEKSKVANIAQSLPDSPSPVWRATRVAAKLNQINLASLETEEIGVSWKSKNRYAVKINGEELVEINSETLLPDTTKDPARDALQVTNRLRRLLVNGPPLNTIAGIPQPKPQIIKQAKQVIAQAVKVGSHGMASWYGPGFNGRRSANGERYNQNGLTAAHRSLPFGTKVRVTNVRTGRSVVVRITDRGPHVRGRIIDLSAAAARIVGVMQSGVAPVRLEIMGR
ncbi:septal ring lytic transglycosylase RlpA family protein [Synechocystis sp. PCC 7509]|uniref:septal ring lytic transglycosylase RlpA family protein n=1 Tax=Synechocystis sp. PCC 7509 TaxID=927677 RepID=UPI0002AC96E2|nr:septal ring lytic transglycosylase RlpA family protein [Synechocystis sp. PCC 7509]